MLSSSERLFKSELKTAGPGADLAMQGDGLQQLKRHALQQSWFSVLRCEPLNVAGNWAWERGPIDRLPRYLTGKVLAQYDSDDRLLWLCDSVPIPPILQNSPTILGAIRLITDDKQVHECPVSDFRPTWRIRNCFKRFSLLNGHCHEWDAHDLSRFIKLRIAVLMSPCQLHYHLPYPFIFWFPNNSTFPIITATGGYPGCQCRRVTKTSLHLFACKQCRIG